MPARGLSIRGDLHSARDLRRLAKREKAAQTARRILAIANAMEGMKRADAARAAGIERQSLCDAVKRYNAEGLAGLYDRKKPGRPERLSQDERRTALRQVILDGP